MSRRLIGIAVSAAILTVLWWRVDVSAIVAAARVADPVWFWSAVAMTVPLTLATSERFRVLADGAVGLGTSVRLILSASTLNLILPSKLGDIAKAWVLRRRDAMDEGRALALVVFEKLLDLMSLLAMAVPAFLLARLAGAGPALALAAVAGGAAALFVAILPGVRLPIAIPLPARLGAVAAAWGAQTRAFWARPGRAAAILLGSFAIWLGHLVQLWLFARALAPAIPFPETAACATLAILAGLLPFTFAGVGTRDAAIVLLFAPWLSGGEAALLGLFATLRYILPALAGLPFVGDYWQTRAR